MPNNFGDTFVDSYKFGTKIAQDEQQHAQAVAMEEQKLAATQAMEAVKMEALNKQIESQTSYQNRMLQHQYESDANQIRQQQLQTFNSQFGMIDPKEAAKYGIKAVPIESQQGSFDRLPLKEQKGLWITDTGSLAQLRAYKAIEFQQSKLDAKDLKDDEFMQRMMMLTKVANENVRGLTKEEIVPGKEPGLLVKSYRGWKESSDSFNIPGTPIVNPAWWLGLGVKAIKGVANAFSSGSPTQTNQIIDESKLGPAMDKQAEIIQAMEIGLLNKKVNPKLADTYLDPQKSTLLQMADSRLTKDANGIPITLNNTQGMSTATVGKIKDILDEIRLRQLANQARNLNNQRTELQVEQLQNKVQ
jgi:hypothetical protein